MECWKCRSYQQWQMLRETIQNIYHLFWFCSFMFDISGLVKIDENVDKCKCQMKTKDYVQELAPGMTGRKILKC